MSIPTILLIFREFCHLPQISGARGRRSCCRRGQALSGGSPPTSCSSCRSGRSGCCEGWSPEKIDIRNTNNPIYLIANMKHFSFFQKWPSWDQSKDSFLTCVMMKSIRFPSWHDWHKTDKEFDFWPRLEFWSSLVGSYCGMAGKLGQVSHARELKNECFYSRPLSQMFQMQLLSITHP